MPKFIQRAIQENHFRKLSEAGIHPTLARILAARGIATPSELENTFSHMISPDKLLNLDKAATLLADAIMDQQKMTVVADYDCDGATACATAIEGIRMLGGNIDYLMPDRFTNGYGLTPAISEQAYREHQTDVLITVDNGISSIDGVRKAVDLGMKVVITDHHLPGEKMPDGCIIVNPNQRGCDFPSKSLAGVGVIFYVLLGIRAEMRTRGIFSKENQPRIDTLLDFVALGTVADVVPLDHNNRILVAQGLHRIRSGLAHPGINALFSIASRRIQKASVTDLGFSIGPRLNAAGRLSDMSIGVECLLAKQSENAFNYAKALNDINGKRQKLEEDMQEEAMDNLRHFDTQKDFSICIHSGNWHQGIIGLLASHIREKFYRPTIVFTTDSNGNFQGSGRSIPQIHLRDAIARIAEQQPDIILKFGGHAMAAGLTVQGGKLDEFSGLLETDIQHQLSYELPEPVIETDGTLDTGYLSEDFVELLGSIVWGQHFPSPTFYDEFTVLDQRILKNAHLKLRLKRNGHIYNAIQFGNNALLPEKIHLAYRPVINDFNNRKTVELMIESVDI